MTTGVSPIHGSVTKFYHGSCQMQNSDQYFIHLLVHNDTHGIVEQAFSENNGIQLISSDSMPKKEYMYTRILF